MRPAQARAAGAIATSATTKEGSSSRTNASVGATIAYTPDTTDHTTAPGTCRNVRRRRWYKGRTRRWTQRKTEERKGSRHTTCIQSWRVNHRHQGTTERGNVTATALLARRPCSCFHTHVPTDTSPGPTTPFNPGNGWPSEGRSISWRHLREISASD